MAIISGSDDQGKLSALITLLSEHAMFMQELQSRQPDVDEAVKTMKRTSAPSIQTQVFPSTSPSGKLTIGNEDIPSVLKKNAMTSSMTSASKLNKSGNLNEKHA